MLASELLTAAVVDAGGAPVGHVCDVRFRRDGDGFRADAVVVCDGALARLAHGWGFGEGHAEGPWLVRRLLAPGARRILVVAADDVAEWSTGAVRLRRGAALRPLRERR